MNKIVIFLISISSVVQANILQNWIFEYKAHKAYGSCSFSQANQDWSQLLQNNPYDAIVNYNIGLGLYQQKKYEQALSYFKRSIEHAGSDNTLQEQALFNAGNTYVQKNELTEAIHAYEKVLKMNPSNARAKNNLEYVKQLQQQQEQQKNQQQDQKDQKQDQQKSDSQSDNQDQKSNQKNQEQNQDQEKDSQSSDKKQEQKDQQQQNAKQNQSKDQKEDKKNQQNENSEQQQNEKSQQQQEQDKKSKEQQKSDKEEKNSTKNKENKDKQQQQQEDVAQDLKKSKKDIKNEAKSQTAQQETQQAEQGQQQEVALTDAYATDINQKPQDDTRLDKRAAMVLQKMNEQEKYVQKELLKLNAAKQGASNYGQKNW